MADRTFRAVFIEPRPPSAHIFSKMALPRLGSVLLATILKQQGWEVSLFIEEAAPIEFSRVLSADLVGISTITSTAPRAYAMADEIRAAGVPVVLGGPHVTFLTGEALEHADFVVRGEGEKAIVALAEHFTRGRPLAEVPGLSWRAGGEEFHNPVAEPVADLDSLPLPDPSLVEGLGGKGFFGYRVVPIQTTRGCPFNCDFCSVVKMFGRRLRKRSVENVLAELARHDDPKTHVFFYDDNFTADRGHALAICRAISAAGFRFEWSAQVRADVARDETLLGAMREAGCSTVYIGFETVNPAALAASHKSQTPEEMAEAARRIRRARIGIHGMFIYGFDSDNRRNLRDTLRFAKRMGITTAQFLLLTPIPGTTVFEDLRREGRLLFSDWSLYDGHHVVFQPRRLLPRELQREQVRAHRNFYSRLRNLGDLLRMRLLRVVTFLHARGIIRTWKRQNRLYLKVLSLLSRPGRHTLRIDITPRFPEVKAAVDAARRRLSAPASGPRVSSR